MPDEVVSMSEIKGSRHMVITGEPPSWLLEHTCTLAEARANRDLAADFRIPTKYVFILNRARMVKIMRRHPLTSDPYRSDEIEILPGTLQIVIIPVGAIGKVIPGHGYTIANVEIVDTSGEPDKGQLTVEMDGKICASKYGRGRRGSGGTKTRTDI